MNGANPTAYIRVPLTASNPASLQSLTLQMKYDDGFVAYVNGQEVARRNAPATLAFNSQATASHPDADAVVYENLSVPVSAMQAGNNVLAIQGLNVLPTSSAFLIYPDLQG